MIRRTRATAASAALAVAAAVATPVASAADLPRHRPLRILVVSDEVNPHGLADADLTQPGEISLALAAPDSGLSIAPGPDALLEVPTNSIEQATALLALPRAAPGAYDVLIYFAHRIPDDGNDDLARQQAFDAAAESFVAGGGGIVSFHHGAYLTAGKADIVEVLGAAATGGVTWDTTAGQRVINVAPDRFVTCHGVAWPELVAYADPARAVPADTYAAFTNLPDERYPTFEEVPSAVGHLEILFASDYDQNGTTHLLGFEHRRPEWAGRVVAYQPGEYQPNALDDRSGPNFQILANAILIAAGRLPGDEILLEVEPGPLPDDATLSWTACPGDVTVYRATSAEGLAAPGNAVTTTAATSLSDAEPASPLLYYLVARP